MVGRYLSIGFFLCFVSIALAANVDVDVSVDRDRVGVGEPFVLTIAVSGGGRVGEPVLSNMEGFEILGKSTSQSFSIINMQMSRSTSFQYRIVPLSEGTYSIGPFRVKVDDNTYEAGPIEIVVVKSSGRSVPSPAQKSQTQTGTSRSTGDDVLLIASVDKRRAFVGEQITYTLKFAYRVRLLENPDYTPPNYHGFWSEAIGEEGPEIEEINGARYYVWTSRTALFPISSGEFTIGEAMVRYVAEDERARRDPFGIFGSDPFGFFGGTRGREGIVKSKPIEIEVLPLPKQGMPDDFTGAVGKFSIAVEPQSAEVRVGESLTLLVTVEGEGNLKSVDDIPVPRIEGFRVFAPKARETNWKKEKRIGGSKKFEIILVPERAGTYKIQGLEFVYFDPSEARYVRASASPIEVNVLPGEGVYEGKLPQETYISRKDIRYIKTDFDMRDDLRLELKGAFGSLIEAGPALIVAFGIAIYLIRKQVAKGGRMARKAGLERSLRQARKAIGLVERGGDVSEAASIASQALRSYIALLLGVSPQEVDSSVIKAMENISNATREDLGRIIEDLDRVRFAPIGCDRQEVKVLIETTENLLRRIGEEWGN